MRVNAYERIAGTTFKGTWVNSGVTPSPISSALKDRSGAVVSSLAATSSGNGLYFALHQLPNSAQPLLNEWRAWVNSFEYVNRQLVNVIDVKVD